MSAETVEFKTNVSGMRDNVIDVLAGGHGLHLIGHELGGEIPADQEEIVTIDVAFARHTPNLPVENVLSRLDNYSPDNPSQTALLDRATRLAAYRNPLRTAGLIVCGPAGTGKTHISVGVAKHAMITGQTPAYINASGNSPTLSGPRVPKLVEEADIIIADDMNSPYKLFASSIFAQILGAMHDKGGGKLLVTSNYSDPDSLMTEVMRVATHSNEAGMRRLQDRIASSLLGMVVEGYSYRQQIAIQQRPWFDEE